MYMYVCILIIHVAIQSFITIIFIILYYSGYEVQFHVVDEETVYMDGVPDISGQLVTPNGPIATMEGSQMSPDPLSFRMTYTSNELPKQVKVGDDIQEGALKNGASYTVVTVAYTELTNDVS